MLIRWLFVRPVRDRVGDASRLGWVAAALMAGGGLIGSDAAGQPLSCPVETPIVDPSVVNPMPPGGGSNTRLAADLGAIADSIASAVERLDGDRLPQVDASQAAVVSAMRRADQYIRDHSSPQVYRQWVDYLQWDELSELIEADAKTSKLGPAAVQLRFRLIGLTPGLDRPVLRDLRDDLGVYIAALRFTRADRTVELLTRRMEATAESIRESIDEDGAIVPSADIAAEITELALLLRDANQVPQLREALRRRLRFANVAVVVRESIFRDIARRPVNRPSPVDQCILGTRVIGDAVLNGVITADLKPARDAVGLTVTLDGTFNSNNTGYNGPVRLRTLGSGIVRASRSVQLTRQGSQLGPPIVAASLDSRVVGIETDRRLFSRLIRRVASKRVGEQKPAADAIAVARLKQQIADQFAQQTAEALQLDPPQVDGQIRPWLEGLDLPLPPRRLNSTENEVIVDATFSDDERLAAAIQRPPARDGEIAIQVHESLVLNASTTVLAGRTMTRTELERLVARTGFSSTADDADRDARNRRDVAPGGMIDAVGDGEADDDEDDDDDDDDEEDFEVTFDRTRPIIFEAREGAVRLGIRVSRFRQGNRNLRKLLEVFAVYEPQSQPDGSVVLVRRGSGKVDFPGTERLGIPETGVRNIIRKRIADVFPQRLLTRTLTVPTTVQVSALAGRSFRPSSVRAEMGWLTIGLR